MTEDCRYLAVTVLLRGNRADRQVLARGIELAEANRARLHLALLASPTMTAYLRFCSISAGSDPGVIDRTQQEVLRQALDMVPASTPVTTRILNTGPFAALRRLAADSGHCLLVPDSPRFSLLARLPLRIGRIRGGTLSVVDDRRSRSAIN